MDMFIKQEWQDARVKIPEELFEYGDESITLPSQFFENLWQPDLYFLNSKVIGKSSIHSMKTDKTIQFLFFCRNCYVDSQVFFSYTIQK